MSAADERKVVLVTRATRLQELVARFNTTGQAKFYVESLGADFADYLEEDRRYRAAVAEAERRLGAVARWQRIDRALVPNFIFGPRDVVAALGPDGLVANTLKYLDGQPLIGVNSDPARWDGRLTPFVAGDLDRIAADTFAGRRSLKDVAMARAALNNGATLYAVNDLFIGARSHVSARYAIRWGEFSERQSSSGIVVSTGLGSTGWLASFHAGWRAAAAAFGVAAPSDPCAFDWNADHLQFFVREPYPSRATGAALAYGRVSAGRGLTVVSEMPENGVIFSDGVEADALEFAAGVTATIGLAERKGRLVT